MLASYEEVREGRDNFLLLGNGFSIGLHRGFAYGSLYERCAKKLFKLDDIQLFEGFRTTNFERVLGMLSAARQVNNILGIDTKPVVDRHEAIRLALVEAVQVIHPRKASIGVDTYVRLVTFLTEFDGIFTTNYDLLLYWAIMENTNRFVDFFFDGGVFDPTDVEVRSPKIGVYYLHGSLFLYREFGRTHKQSSHLGHLLDELGEYITSRRTPVFVSEGTSEDKLTAIMSNGYLSFCFDQLTRVEGGLTIHGFSMADNDIHIVDAINASKIRKVAYGIYCQDRTDESIRSERLRIESLLPKAKVAFYDSATFSSKYLKG